MGSFSFSFEGGQQRELAVCSLSDEAGSALALRIE